MEEVAMLWMLTLVMLVGSCLAGSLPLVMSLSEDKLQLVSVLGAGLLVGTALAVIIPEGIRALFTGEITNGKELHGDLHSLIGISLVLGFVFMLLIDQCSARKSDGRQKSVTATLGLVVHAAVDGVALGAAATTSQADVEVIVFLAIMLHKAPAAFGLVSFLLHEGVDKKRISRHLLIFSLAAPCLALVTYFGIGKEDKKAEVEARVEEARRREKEELRKERQQLFLSRKRQLAEVRALEAKLTRSRQFQDWRNAQLPLVSFIKTHAQPSIYYVPKRKHPQTDMLLVQSTKELHEEIERREKALVEELNLIEVQIGLGKHSQNFEASSSLHTVEAAPLIQEGEENRDPNPEHNIETAINDNADISIQSIINENFDNDHTIEKKEEVQLEIVQPEVNNG